MSIAASGFFRHEPVIVAREKGENVVIEGNRRLAAVKLLLSNELANELHAKIPDINEETRKALAEIPVVFGTRKDAWPYLGFKHINGPARWSSYAKSQYIADVHKTFGISLDHIAKQIGDTHRTVQRLFRGLMVIEEAERLKVFNREDRWNNHFSFSHLYTGLQYQGISSFISLRSEADENQDPVPIEKKQELGELCLWMYGSKKAEKSPVIKRQNPHLLQLDAVLNHSEALSALRTGESLAHAFEASCESSTVFEDALHSAKRKLQKAHSFLSIGYDGSTELLRTAGTVATLADDLYNVMYRKSRPSHAKRFMEND